MEVYLETGMTITEHNRKTQEIPPKYHPIRFTLTDRQRQTLYDRIDRRVDAMVEAGLIDEIQGLLARGIPEKCTAMQAIGYKEFVAALHGACSLEEAAGQVKQSSRRYAKRQLTWFRRNPENIWLIREDGQTSMEILDSARQYLRDFDK